MKSLVKEIGPVEFPAFTGERVYMLPFFQPVGLPEYLKRWQATVDAMLVGIRTEQPIYLMIDQSEVFAGKSHRRPGAHIDGNWIPAKNNHGGGGSGGGHGVGRHKPANAIAGHWNNGMWKTEDFAPEAIILASSVTASCGFIGEIEGDAKVGGDCTHLDLSPLSRIPLIGGKAYAGNVTFIHESLPVAQDCKRSLVRLNLPSVEL